MNKPWGILDLKGHGFSRAAQSANLAPALAAEGFFR
jgi:hypothetical protein